MSRDLIHSITQQMPGFSKGQKLIAQYILAHYDKAAFMTAAKLRMMVGISAVSYTHLDVYKGQAQRTGNSSSIYL